MSTSSRGWVSSGVVRATSAPVGPTSTISFDVHPGMAELQTYAREQGWFDRGFHQLSVAWLELRYTADGWKTTKVLKSTDVPSPITNGVFQLPKIPKGTEIEFAIHVGLNCHAPQDSASYRERGELWLNNDGQNYRQTTK